MYLNSHHPRLAVPGIALAAGMLVGLKPALDGTESLNHPSIGHFDGTDWVLGGVGLSNGLPGVINILIPDGVAIKRVFAYWEGQAATADEQGDLDTVTIEGLPVTGARIGGPTQWETPEDRFSSSYRADITRLGLLVNGANVIDVSGLDFSLSNDGLGLAVAVDDGVTAAALSLKDGNDTAFFDWSPPLDTTVPVTYSLAPFATDHEVSLGFMVGSVGHFPTVIDIQFNGLPGIRLNDVLGSNNGPEWDAFEFDFLLPAGTSSVTVQILSEDSGDGQFADEKPASLVWVASTFTLSKEEPPPPGGEGCTPGYWKNHLDSWDATGYLPTDIFDQVFGVNAFGSKTLFDVIKTGGGGLNALGRHAVAALLSAAHPDVDYDLTEAEVLVLVHDAIVSGDPRQIERVKDQLDELNNARCPLN